METGCKKLADICVYGKIMRGFDLPDVGKNNCLFSSVCGFTVV